MDSEAGALLSWVQAIHFENLAAAGGVALAVWLGVQGLHRVVQGLLSMAPAHRLTILRIQTLITFIMYLAGGAGITTALLSPKPELMLALAGSLAVAVGLSLKDVASSIFAGVILLFDQPFQVGDRVRFGNEYGDIVSIGLRSVKMLTLGHDLVTIPNSSFLTDVVASGNSGSMSMMVTVRMHISVEADVERARELLHEVVTTSRFAWLKNGVSVGVEEVVGENLHPMLALTARCYVTDVQYEKEFATDITVRATRAFRQAGIPRFTPGMYRA